MFVAWPRSELRYPEGRVSEQYPHRVGRTGRNGQWQRLSLPKSKMLGLCRDVVSQHPRHR